MTKRKFIHDDMSQDFYDSFNNFIFANETKVLEKLISKYKFLEQTRNIPGDIVELGVFKGSGVAAWLKLARSAGLRRTVYGFDIFDSQTLVNNITTIDRDLMASLFKDRGFNPQGYAGVLANKLRDLGHENFHFVTGDIHETIPIFLEKNPGFRASLINFDLDTFEPTYFALEQLWDRVVPGGVLIFDEYGINEWTESDAVDKFLLKKKQFLQCTNFFSPSAFLIK
jgi:hypothetical protein